MRPLAELYVDVAFLGMNGVSVERGSTTPDPAEEGSSGHDRDSQGDDLAEEMGATGTGDPGLTASHTVTSGASGRKGNT